MSINKRYFPTSSVVYTSILIGGFVIVFALSFWNSFDSRIRQFAKGEVVLATETNVVAKLAEQASDR
jgi:hypothetical protein